MKNYMDKLDRVNVRQTEFGQLLGLNLKGLTKRVALAMIRDNIETKFNGIELRAATEKQIALGRKFSLDLSNLTAGVASAYIKDVMETLNFKSIDEQDINPGDYVINKYDKSRTEHIVSSISKEGYLYFKKSGGGAARYMIKSAKELR